MAKHPMAVDGDRRSSVSRRGLLAGAGLVAGTWLGGCSSGLEDGAVRGARSSAERRGRLTFRLAAAGRKRPTIGAGHHEVTGLPGAPAAALYLPESLDDRPARLVVALHGAGSSAERGLGLLLEHADRHRLLLVAPKSVGRTWDVVRGGYGPDVANIDRLLRRLARRLPVSGVSVCGFSDGASYALSLGLSNGAVFDSVVAFSPGFEAVQVPQGRPRVFVSHGVHDGVLPIDTCSRRIVPQLEDDGYDVTYTEFDGGHRVPWAVAGRAAEWMGGR